MRKSFEEIANDLVASVPRGDELDFSEASLSLVEEMLEWAAANRGEMSADDQRRVIEGFGCYILEVARRTFGGRYAWHDQTEQPVLVVGEPDKSVALMAWTKVEGRLLGDDADNIVFHFEGFAERVRKDVAGDSVIYI
ncbi:hypothetical protein [Terricaulis silvestris]|uniref:hypothetical protein n=1 Tax=Terricaulis silvestris TaxID=2686094 RepID=UPI001E339E17|nr:hypothetical protein [Terricaulis silvestris]